MNEIRVGEKYIPIINACLDKIRKEMDRLYWNENQQEMISPFDNTGANYENSTFVVRAYDWGDEEEISLQPNFNYKGLRVHWYKYSGRGVTAKCDQELTLDFLADMVNDCITSLRKDFGEDEEV